MADPPVPPAPLRPTEAGDHHRDPPQGINPVDVLPYLHPAESQPGPRAHIPGPHGDNHQIRPGDLAGGRQSRVDIHRLQIPPEGMAAGDGGLNKPLLLQFRHGTAESQGEGGAVGHQVDQTAAGLIVFNHRRRRGQHAVQLSNEDGHALQPAKGLQLFPVSRRLLLAGQDLKLARGIAHLHNMAALLEGRQGPAEIVIDKVHAAGAQAQVKGGSIEQHQVALGNGPGKIIVVDGQLPPALHNHRHFAYPRAGGQHLNHQAYPFPDQPLPSSLFDLQRGISLLFKISFPGSAPGDPESEEAAPPR